MPRKQETQTEQPELTNRQFFGKVVLFLGGGYALLHGLFYIGDILCS